MKSSVQFSPNRHLENISKLFKKLYNEEQLSDVTLCCKDGSIKAHKLILAASSPYFHRIFTENNRDHLILIMHGIAYQNLHTLMELLYKGNVDVVPESLNALYELAGEFQISGISGVLRDEMESSFDMSRSDGGHGRDTRYRGLKRVAVDYKESDPLVDYSATKRFERENSDTTRNDEITNDDGPEIHANGHSSEVTDSEDVIIHSVSSAPEPAKLSAWAKKQRKFKCDLCPSSFKRSSHLTRHQLVHTGERPFACEQCDKAFSRHDKLKHHVRKTHEQEFDNDFGVEIPQNMEIVGHPLESSTPSPPPFVISHVRSAAEDELCNSTPPKRPRGRPRKYPPMPKPLIKRGRGRPRLNPVQPENNGENYDITNLPFGDLEYLTMPLQEPAAIEPYVEIKTEKEEQRKEANKELTMADDGDEGELTLTPTNLKEIENRIAKIGECTISVANH